MLDLLIVLVPKLSSFSILKGFDDAEAIMLLLAAPHVDVVGITCVNGNVNVHQVCSGL